MTRGQIGSLFVVLVALIFMGYKRMSGSAPSNNQPIPAPLVDAPLADHPTKEVAVFAGGCFWGTQTVFQQVKGVTMTYAGYSGGTAATATYDRSKITYGTLLRIFFSVAHDPTQLNRQGPDVGKSYRSAIFYLGDEQRKIAEAYIQVCDVPKTRALKAQFPELFQAHTTH